MNPALKLRIEKIKNCYLDYLTDLEKESLTKINDESLNKLERKILILNIRKYYIDSLTAEEASSLEMISNEALASIVNKIWQDYLTNPFDNESKIHFNYLVWANNLDLENIPNNKMHNGRYPSYPLYILNNANIIAEYTGRVGYILVPNWTRAEKLLLPIDFLNERIGIYVRAPFRIMAVFCTSIGAGAATLEYQTALELAEENKLLFVDLNKMRYQPDYKPLKYERDDIANSIVCEFLFNKSIINTKIRDALLNKYRKDILKKYDELKASGDYDALIFSEMMIEYIASNENTTNYKL